MRILRGIQPTSVEHRGATVALGNFDGVHLGHRAVLDAASAARPDAPLGVVSFDPHPRRFFQPDAPPFELMDLDAKVHALGECGVGPVFLLPFDATLAAMSPEAFCAEILIDDLGVRHVAVGEDFRFGAMRLGDADTLRAQGARLGFGVTVLPREIEASSSAIRKALAEGRPRDAAKMIGAPHRVDGPVLHGEKRGRELGWPTANMSLDAVFPPRFGVYAVRIDIMDGPFAQQGLDGVASLGVRPMFGDNTPNLETYIFDFDKDIYGAELSVHLIEWLRPEETFDSIAQLTRQIEADAAQARRILAESR